MPIQSNAISTFIYTKKKLVKSQNSQTSNNAILTFHKLVISTNFTNTVNLDQFSKLFDIKI